jgi:hypothetical protein
MDVDLGFLLAGKVTDAMSEALTLLLEKSSLTPLREAA